MNDADGIVQVLTKRCTNQACPGFTEPLPLDQFRRTKEGKLVSRCRRCESQRTRDYQKRFPERAKQAYVSWYARNREQWNQKRKARYAQQDPEQKRQDNQASYQRYRHLHLAYRHTHRAQDRQNEIVYYWRHREARIAFTKAYQKAHPDEAITSQHRKRARKAGIPVNDLTAAEWKALKARYQYRCAYCGTKPKLLTIDHITPISQGGANCVSNILPTCRPCNNRKHTGKPPVPVQPVLFA